jgi:hypothetical protein
MTRIRLVLLGVLAVVAASALASTSASAAECPDTVKGADVALCIEGKEAADGVYPFTSVKKPNTVFELNVKNGPRMVCENAKNAGEFEVKDAGTPQLEVSDLVIEFSGNCKVTTNEPECEVEPIVLNGGGDGIDGSITKTNEMAMKPSTGKVLGTLKIKSKPGHVCVLSKEATIEGGQIMKLPGSTTETTRHELVAEASGSSLTISGIEATFVLTEEMELTSGKVFSLQES